MGGWRLPGLALVCSLLAGVAASSSVLDSILGDLANQLAGDYGYPDYANDQPDYADMQDTVYQPEPKPAKPTGNNISAELDALYIQNTTILRVALPFARKHFIKQPTQPTVQQFIKETGSL